MLFFILFGVFSGVVSWLVVKNEAWNVNNPEFRLQFDSFKRKIEQERRDKMLVTSAVALMNKTQLVASQHLGKKLHYYIEN